MRAGDQPPDPLELALAYPYPAPACSFVLSGPSPEDVRDAGPADPSEPPPGRVALLAYGSNASPEVLARKLGASLADDPVLGERTTLADFDVVYSAHVSRYGAIPATLERSPGTEAKVFVLHLTETQLELLAPTEPNYELVGLRGASCAIAGAERRSGVVAYLSRHGPLLLDGEPAALAAVEARERRFRALVQREALELVREVVAPELSLERLVSAAAADPGVAARYTEALKRRSAKRASNP